MSGPVTTNDVVAIGEAGHPASATVEVSESRAAQVGALRVRRPSRVGRVGLVLRRPHGTRGGDWLEPPP